MRQFEGTETDLMSQWHITVLSLTHKKSHLLEGSGTPGYFEGPREEFTHIYRSLQVNVQQFIPCSPT